MFSWIQSQLRWLMSSNSPDHKPDGGTQCREQRRVLSPPDFQVAEFLIGTGIELSDSLVTTIDVIASPGWIDTEINAETMEPLELTPDHTAWHLRLCHEGSQLMDQGRFSEAAEAFSKAIDLAPQFSDALAKRSICYRESGDKAIAVGEDSRAYQAFLKSRNDVYRIADLQGSLDWTQADMLFAVEIRIAQTLSRIGRASEVLDACASACRLPARRAQGLRQIMLDACASACRLLQPVVESMPETGINAEERCSTRKRHRAEMRSLRDTLLWLLEKEPDLTTLLAVCTRVLNLGRTCHTALKMFDLAEELFHRGVEVLVRLPPDELAAEALELNAAWSLQARAHNYRRLLFLDTGHTNSAEAEFLKAVKLRQWRMEITPQDFENQIYLGGTYCNLGQASLDLWETDIAVRYFVRSIETLKGLTTRCSPSFRQIAEAFLRNSEQGLQEARKWQATNCSPPELVESLCFEEAAHKSDSLPDAMPDPSVDDVPMDPADATGWYRKGMSHSERASSAIAGGIHIHAFHFPAAMEALACFDKSQRIMPYDITTLLAKARILTRLARATDAKSKTLHHAALLAMNNQDASERYVLPIRRRFQSYLLRAGELLEQVNAICPTNHESVLLKATLQREYPDLSEL